MKQAAAAHILRWNVVVTAALTESTEERVSPQQAREDKKRIKELERDLKRKDKTLAEAAALLVLSKQMEAIFRSSAGARTNDRKRLAKSPTVGA